MTKLIAFIFWAWLRVVINIALAAILGYFAMQLWLLHFGATPSANDSPHSRIPLIINQSQISAPIINVSPLLKAHLFGKSTAFATQIATQVANNPPATKLNLKLHGIFYSSEPHNSYAMIALGKGKSILYRLGKSLPNGVVLQKIGPKQVILLRNGRYEALRFVEPKGTTIKNYAKNMQKTITGNRKPEKLLGNYQRQLRANPQSLMKLMRIFPVRQGGRFLGYRLKSGKDASLLSQFNLKSGDILTAVNGVKLDSPLKGLGVVQQLATANQIDLQVLRNGQVMSLSFAVEK